ncbi:MAG: PorV/PorQ family protein [Ignavibacteriae bacterium]|nr:MAG: PorV/PorQ family protein [Ignavibacteriota bacterium]
MKFKKILILFLIFISAKTAEAQLIPVLGSQRAGTSSLQFLKIGVGGRATAMGESFVAVANDITALYWNPAGLVQFPENGVHFSHSEWLVDLKHEYFGGVYRIGKNNAVGLSVTSLHTPAMQKTTEFEPNGTGEYFKYGDLAFGLSFARKLTDQFSFGISLKYVEETLAELKMRGYMFDLGTYYWTGLYNSRFAVTISNFGPQVKPTGSVTLVGNRTLDNFQSFPPPTIFRIGFAIDPIDNPKNKLTTSIQLNHPNDNAENINIGAEYAFKDMLFIRGGYKFNVESENFSAGIGLKVPVLITKTSVDYSIANYKDLGFTHRLSINLLFNKK